MKSIDDFVAQLRKQKNTDTVKNPYRHKVLAENLSAYLCAMRRSWARQKCRRVLMVGEAPGYKGCMLTGVPFSSGRIYQDIHHPFLTLLKTQLTLTSNESENTASIVWRYLAESEQLPLFWNAFPFHPHVINNAQSNRAPTRAEVLQGKEYLQSLQHIFKPEVIVGVGQKGTHSARVAFPDQSVFSVRHPSFGGKKKFVHGMNVIFKLA